MSVEQFISIGGAIVSLVGASLAVVLPIVRTWHRQRQESQQVHFTQQQKSQKARFEQEQESQKAIFDQEQEDRKVKFTEQGAIIDRLEKHNAHMTAQVEQLQRTIDRINRAVTELWAENAELRLQLALLHDCVRRQNIKLHDAGQPVETIPELLPPRKKTAEIVGAAEFDANSVTQNTKLIAKEGELLKADQQDAGGL